MSALCPREQRYASRGHNDLVLAQKAVVAQKTESQAVVAQKAEAQALRCVQNQSSRNQTHVPGIRVTMFHVTLSFLIVTVLVIVDRFTIVSIRSLQCFDDLINFDDSRLDGSLFAVARDLPDGPFILTWTMCAPYRDSTGRRLPVHRAFLGALLTPNPVETFWRRC